MDLNKDGVVSLEEFLLVSTEDNTFRLSIGAFDNVSI